MNSHTLVPVFTGEINGQTVQLVNARDLHQFLESKQQFSDWIKNRIKEYGFIENQDFLLHKFMEQGNGLISENYETKRGRGGDQRSIDYHLTLDMAKELAMVERNAKGREARKYFIAIEQAFHEGRKHLPPPAADYAYLHDRHPFGKPVNPKYPKDPFERVNASALQAYLNMGLPDLAHAYLLHLGITPKLVNQTLAEYNVLPPLLGRPGKHPPISDAQLTAYAVEFMRDWERGEYRTVYAPCLGVQALRLFKHWLAKKAVKTRRKDDDLLDCLLRLPGVQQLNNPNLPDFGALGQSDKKKLLLPPNTQRERWHGDDRNGETYADWLKDWAKDCSHRMHGFLYQLDAQAEAAKKGGVQ